jgi:outer membrane protein assembly factor BamA/autotransporter translocation and assembly factor TamB
MWKLVKRVGLLLLAVGIVLAGGALVVVQTSAFQQWLLRRVEKAAASAGFQLTAEGLELSIWRLQASLQRVAWDDGKTIRVKIDRLFIDVPGSVIRGDLTRITALEADGVAIDIHSITPAAASKPFEVGRITFDRLAIRNASLTYSDGARTIRIPAFNIELQNGDGVVHLDSPVTISPERVQVAASALAVHMSDRTLDFGPSEWQIEHPDITVTGSSRGHFEWSPSLALDLAYSTKPLSFQNWRNLESSGNISYQNGTIRLTDFLVRSGTGTVAGIAQIGERSKSVNLRWSSLDLAPAGVPATANGNLQLEWQADDFSDAFGQASIAISSRRYGRAQVEAAIRDARADVDIRAYAFDVNVHANLVTGLDQRLSGKFQATHTQYGNARVEGTLSRRLNDPEINAKLTASEITYNGIGPFDASANLSLRSGLVSADDIAIQLKNSKARGHVAVELDSRRLAGALSDIQVQLADIAPGVEGTAALAAAIGGTVEKPSIRITGSSGGFDVAGTHVDSVQVAAEADTESFHLTELTARQRDAVLSANGSYNLKTGTISADMSMSNLEVDQVPDAIATASLTSTLSGTIKAPVAQFRGRLTNIAYRNQAQGDVDFEGTIQNDVASVQVQSGKYAASATAEIRLKEPYPYTASVTTDNSRIGYQQYAFVANGRVRASGTLSPFNAEMLRLDDIAVAGAGVDLRATGSLSGGIRLNATADLARLPQEAAQLTGQARIQAVVTGRITDPRIEGSLETTDATIRAAAMAEAAAIQAAVDFTRNEFTIRRLQTSFQGATAEIKGQGTLEGRGHFEFRAENIKPERLLKDAPLAGVLALEGDVDVAKPDLEGIAASVKVTQLELNVNDIPIHQTEPVELRLEKQVVSARSFSLEGLNTRAAITGNANLRTRALNLDVEANTDLKILEAVLPGSNPAGRIRTRIALRGTPEQPRLDGFVNLADMELQIAEPPVSLSEANAEIEVRGDRVEIISAAGTINGGKFTASGAAGVSSSGLGTTALKLKLTGVQTEYPEGFESEISSDLSITGSGKDFEVSGNINVLNGAYRKNIDLTQAIFSRITSEAVSSLPGRPAESAMIDRIRLNITVETPGEVAVINNLANFSVDGAFRLLGTAANPVIVGRASVREGGELYFGPQVGKLGEGETGRRDKYVISEGSIDFNNPVRTEPAFNFVATREIRETQTNVDYIITLRASGTLDKLKTELTSDPSLDERNIIALLLTGRTFENLQGSELNIAQEQAANYLAGRVGNLFQSAGSTFGLTTVRIDPVLTAGEEDPTAKLTIGKDITRNFNLIYSQNLSGARAQTWIASYQAFKDLVIRATNRSADNVLIMDLRHDLKWGGGPPLPAGPARKESRLANVTFEGTRIPMRDLLKEVTRSGKPFNTYRMNEDVRKLRQYLAGRDFLRANIRALRNTHEGTVDVRFVIDEGPSITFTYEGAEVPKGVREDIRQIWMNGLAEATSLRQSENRLLRYFRDEGYLRATVSGRDDSPDLSHRRFAFDIAAGRRFEKPQWVFRGIEPINLNLSPGTVLADPRAVQDQIKTALWNDGYLNAFCTQPQLVIDGTQARFEVSVERGPRYSIGTLTANDIDALNSLPPGEGGHRPGEGVFTAAWLESARQNIIGTYLANGFNDVQVAAATHVADTGTTVDVDFKIDPGEQQIIRRIEIEGYKDTDIGYIRRQFTFKEGDPVDYTRLNITRKKLYDTRLFRRVDLSVVPGDDGYTARTLLNEKPPWNFRYGFTVTNYLQTSDRELGATADFSYSNLLGKAITTGTSLKYTRKLQEGRLFGSLPVLARKNVTTTVAVFRNRDLTNDTFIANRWGFTVQQQWQLGNRYVLSYDYRYERNRNTNRIVNPDDPFALSEITFPIGRLNGTLSRDTRDDILNATKGSFLSNSFEIAPPGVGSSIEYFRNFTQYFRFRPVRERLIWASAVRAGVAKGFHGQQIAIADLQFLAGGGTTVRGFQQDKLANAGDALFIVNQELRFPLLWRFSGAGFIDAGNVYARASDFNPLRLRYSPGAGIRLQTPLVLIRFDVGFNPSRRPGEPAYRFAFGVGQAF